MPFKVTVCSILILLTSTTAQSGDVLTQHNNNARTGATLDETALTTTTVSSSNFGKLWTLFADGQVVAQPLYVSGLAIDTTANSATPLVKGTFNAVIVATMHNTVYVYDADKENRGTNGQTIPLWAKWLGPPRPSDKSIDMWSTNDPEWGILSTPVVSPDRSTLYVVAWHNDGPGGFQYRLHGLNLKDGTDRMPPVNVGKSSSDAPCVLQSVFNPCVQKQRASLLLSNGVLYIAFGGDDNRGSVFAFDALTLTKKTMWSSTPSGVNGGIWQSGQGPAADADGNIYLMVGNGTFDANQPGGKNYGDSFVKLKLDGGDLVVKDYFTPCDQDFLRSNDYDLGSAGPLLLPVTPPRIVSGGKEGVLYVLSPTNMGHYAASAAAPHCQNPNAVQEVNAFPSIQDNGQTRFGNIHGSPVFWNGADTGRVYAWGENSRLKAFTFSAGKLQNVNNPKQSAYRPPNGMPGGMLALSANGNKAGSGILWAVVPLNGDANQQRGVLGIVLALDAQDVSRTLWTSEQFSQRDRLGLFAKFTPPMIAAGKVFVPTYGDTEPLRTYPNNGSHPTTFPQNYYVAVYGLGAATPPRPITNQNSNDVTVVRASTSPLVLDITKCKALDATSVDCTDALTQSAGTPSFHQVVLAANADLTGCALLQVTTASKTAGLNNSTGIGFWSAQTAGGQQAAEDSGRFIPKDQLKTVGTATLVSGDPATLHQFVGVSNCPAAGGDSFARLFKPYMQFETAPNGPIFRNWDLAANYLISRVVPVFDRSTDVLQH
jgi:hypothetical protein